MINLKVEYYGNTSQQNYIISQRINEVLSRRETDDFYTEDSDVADLLEELKDYSTSN